ncbi:MAG TPA: CpaF family protein [Patescibacteria group bacterium]|nr:CpaF family protein [Patescibacteria group bacterium]
MKILLKNNTTLDELHAAVVFELERKGSILSPQAVDEVLITLLQTDQADFSHLRKRLHNRIFSFGVLTDILTDQEVTEVMVNGPEHVYIERQGILSRADVRFESEEELLMVINRIVSEVGRRVDASQPLCDARLADGSRVNVIIPPLSLVGPVLTIRRFPKNAMNLEDLVIKASLSPAMAEFLRACVRAKLNVIISGGTGGGKTTLLNALGSEISKAERLLTIEDSAEMKIDHPHLISLEARQANIEGQGEIPIRTLVKNALRMRPDRIIVGEIRGGEALDMLQAMNTGHQGSLTTVHANAPLEALFRVETMCLMSGVELPLSAVRQQVAQAVHVIVQQERLSDGNRKVTSICMLEPEWQNGFVLRELCKFDKVTDQHVWTGETPNRLQLFEQAKVIIQPEWFA